VSAAAVPETGDMPDEDLVRAEWVSVRAPLRPAGHPLAVRRLHKVAEYEPKPRRLSRQTLLMVRKPPHTPHGRIF